MSCLVDGRGGRLTFRSLDKILGFWTTSSDFGQHFQALYKILGLWTKSMGPRTKSLGFGQKNYDLNLHQLGGDKN